MITAETTEKPMACCWAASNPISTEDGDDERDHHDGEVREEPHPHGPAAPLRAHPPPEDELADGDRQVDEERDRPAGGEQVGEELVGQHVVADHREEAHDHRRHDRDPRHALGGDAAYGAGCVPRAPSE